MPSIYSMADNVRGRLGGPRAQKPNDDAVIREVASHLRHFLNVLDNTGLTWDYRTLTLTVDPHTDTYQIPDTSFGRAFAVLTRDDSNPSHIVRKVDFFEAPNLDFNWGLPNNIGSFVVNLDGSVHSARRVAFYWSNGFPYVRFHPIPQISCDYDISFSIGDATRSMSLDTIPILTQHHDVIECGASRSLLPLSEWDDDREVNAARRQELALSLSTDLTLYMNQFMANARIKNHGAGISRRRVEQW